MAAPSASGGLSPSRIETLCDGVFAIAMTLLVLEIKVPEPHAGEALVHRFVELVPKMASFGVSFVILGTLWVGHHYQFHYIRRSDRPLLWINIGFLLFVSFLPFATGVVGNFPGERAAVLLYGATLLAAGLFLLAQWTWVTSGRRLVAADLDPAVIAAVRARVLAGTGFYAVAMAVTLLSTRAGLLLFALMPLLYLLPSRIDRHVRAPSGT
jgi:uncharacterized membrane protein